MLEMRALKPLVYIFVFIGLFFVLKQKAKNTYNAYVVHDYHNTFHADASGYYVYLPAFFEYGFTNGFPKNQDSICGLGFSIKNDKVITKYTCGVALLQSPFYLSGRVFNKIFNREENGFSAFYMELMDWSGIFYGLAGFFLLYFSLLHYVKKLTAFFSLLFILAGTNVYYYMVVSAAYSHIYSFFLFSAFIFLSIRLHKNYKLVYFILFSCVTSLIVLIRPIDIIVLPLFFFIGNNLKLNFKDEIKKWVTLKHIIVFLIAGLIIFIPQFLYWKFAYGSYLSYSYESEGFPYLLKPKILEFLFAPLNGLIVYCPLYAMLLLSLFFMKEFKLLSISITTIIVVLIYLSASWHVYHFGCSFSGRNFVQYAAILSIPFALFLQNLKNILAKIGVYIIILLFIAANQNMIANFDVCFWGKSEWDWKEYKYLLLSHKKQIEFNFNKKNTLLEPKPVSKNNSNYILVSNQPYFNLINAKLSKLSYIPIRRIEVRLKAKAVNTNTSFAFTLQIKRNGNTIFGNEVNSNCDNSNWKDVYLWTQLPSDLLETDEIVLFFWNRNGGDFYVNNLSLNYQ